MSGQTVRKPAVAGTFYPGRADALRREITSYLDNTPPTAVDGAIVAAMAPHAGYRFSAPVAAHVYKAMRAIEADTVVIVGHDAHADGVIAVLSDVDAFETPLGRVPVDTDVVARLVEAHRGIIVHNDVHRREHSVEVHLPFLQTVMSDFKIVPVLFGEPNPEHCRLFAEELAKATADRTVFMLASTDLSHYPSYDDSREMDSRTMAQVESMDLPRLFDHLEKARREGAARNIQTAMCSSGGVGAAILYAKARGATRATVLNTANSGDVDGGDKSRVVGYGAALFIKPAGSDHGNTDNPAEESEDDEFSLPKAVQTELLTLARERISTALAKEPRDYSLPEPLREVLNRDAAVFVTLHKDGRLRGCIGTTTAQMELWRAVSEMAFSAAFKDWRFSPVKADELDDIDIEISVLSPLRQVDSHHDIVPQKHGVIVRAGGRSGIFLPQVWEQIPEKERFLGVLCSEKAGLDPEAWKCDDTELLVFTVFAFEEG